MPQTRSTKKRAASPTAIAVTLPAKKPRRDDVASSTRQLDNSNNEDSPASRVLQTYELLEQILVKLPLKDLFVLQRVNTTWKDLIGRSEGTRKKMFLLADGTHLEKQCDASFIGTIRLNPIFDAKCEERRHQTRNCDCERRGYEDWECDHWSYPHYDCTTSLGCVHLEDNSWSFTPPAAGLRVSILSVPNERATSARNMFLTQPPITEMRFYAHYKALSNGVIRDDFGIHLGSLMDTFRDAVAEHAVDCEGRHTDGRSCAKEMRQEWVEWEFWVHDKTMALETNPGEDKEPKDCNACRFKDAMMAE